jgi:hypothetical protein
MFTAAAGEESRVSVFPVGLYFAIPAGN